MARCLRLWLCLLCFGVAQAHAESCVVAVSSAGNSSSSPVSDLSLSNPGSQAGDVLLAQIVVGGSNPVSAPSGWTLYSITTRSGVTQRLYYRVAGAAEPASYSFAWSGSARAGGGLLVLRGISVPGSGNPIVQAPGNSGSGSTLSAPSATTTTANSRVVRAFAFGNGNALLGGPATEYYSLATGAGPNGVALSISSATQAAAGASGTASASVAESANWLAVTTVLASTAGGSGSCATPQVDHYELSFASNQALTCSPLSVTLRACANAACSSLYASPASVTLSPSGSGSNWSSNPLTFTGSASLQFQHTQAGTVGLGVSGSPAASNALQCVVGGVSGSCAVSFASSGFILDVPNLLANKPTTATLQAVRMDDSTQLCVPAWQNVERSILFSRSYSSPATGTRPVLVNGTTVTSGTPLTLSFDSSARASLSVQYADAGLIDLSASYTATSGLEAGLALSGSDQFVSKPYGLCLQTDSACSSADAGCALFPGGIRAGDSFPLRIRAVGWQDDGEALGAAQLCSGNVVTPNFQLSGITLSASVQAPSPGANGSVTPADYTQALGDQTEVATAISEVGVFTLTATPTASYFGETVSGGSSALVGRFAPAYLGVAGSASLTPACGSAFSYQGQPMEFAAGHAPSLTVTAYNRGGAVTGNYDRGDFWRLAAPAVGTYASVTGLAGPDARLASQGSVTPSTGGADDGDGARTYGWSGEQLLYQPAALPGSDDYPFAARIEQSFPAASLEDADGACYGAGGTCQDYAYAFEDAPGSEVRLGRLRIDNAHGSELQSLELPLLLESWQNVGGGAFLTEGLDTCTVLGTPALDQYTGNLAAGETTPTLLAPVAGLGALQLSAPGAGNDGSLQVSFPDAPTWLQYPWDGASRQLARGLASFGIYRGAAPLIFRRELYR